MRAERWRARTAQEAAAQAAATGALDPADVRWRERDLEAVFALAHDPEWLDDAWLRHELADNPATVAALATLLIDHAPPGAPMLEVGCGPGRLLRAVAARANALAVGVDLRIGMLRLAARLRDDGAAHLPWRRDAAAFTATTVRTGTPAAAAALPASLSASQSASLVAGNLYAMPFAAEQFGAVVACSLVDIMPDPLEALDALHRLVAPGGALLIAAPWHFSAASTPPAAWWPEPATRLCRELIARGYTIMATIDDLPWSIPSHARLVHRYRLQGVVARKPA